MNVFQSKTSHASTVRSKFAAVMACVAISALSVPFGALPFGWGELLPAAHANESSPQPSRPYGVIEIGAKGVKPYIFDLDRAETDAACSEQDDTYIKCLDPKILPQANVNALEEQSINKTAEAVKDFYDQLGATYQIPPERIFIVGSSSIVRSEHKDTLVAAIKGRIPHLEHPVGFVTVDQEATFDFKGILGMLPRQWRKLRQHQAAVIDIGSGNIKASFMAEQAGAQKVVTIGVNYGTKRATDEINQLRGDVEFSKAANKWRAAAFVPTLRTELDNNPGLGNRNRVYLIGGIVWAMVNVTQPADKSKFPPIRPVSIDKFLAALSAPGGAAKFCSDQNKARYKDVSKACDTFSADNLVAGTEILKGLSDELSFVRDRKNLFFFRDSLYAWPLGYLRANVYGSEAP